MEAPSRSETFESFYRCGFDWPLYTKNGQQLSHLVDSSELLGKKFVLSMDDSRMNLLPDHPFESEDLDDIVRVVLDDILDNVLDARCGAILIRVASITGLL